MNFIGWLISAVIIFAFIGVCALFSRIIQKQKELDAPFAGNLIVDPQDHMVYYQAMNDPMQYKEGEVVKLRVRIVKNSQ